MDTKHAGEDTHKWAWYYTEAYAHILKWHPKGAHWKVYCVLCNYRRWQGIHKNTCYPSYKTIAEQAHVSVNNVAQIVHDLRGLGVITIKYDKVVNRKNRTIGRRRNIYTLLSPEHYHKPKGVTVSTPCTTPL